MCIHISAFVKSWTACEAAYPEASINTVYINRKGNSHQKML